MILLDYKDRRPIYEQVRDGLRRLIVSGTLPLGEKLPSVRELSTQLTINPNTIQKAYRDLESEGYIYTVTGKGTFVAERKEVYDARAKELLTEFDEIVEELFFLSVKEKELVERMDNLAEGKVDQ